MNVGNLDGDVVKSGAALRQKLPDRSFIAEGLQKFNVSVAHGQHTDLDALLFNFAGGVYFQPKRIAPNCQTLFDALSGYSDVINFHVLVSCPLSVVPIIEPVHLPTTDGLLATDY